MWHAVSELPYELRTTWKNHLGNQRIDPLTVLDSRCRGLVDFRAEDGQDILLLSMLGFKQADLLSQLLGRIERPVELLDEFLFLFAQFLNSGCIIGYGCPMF